MDISMRRSCSTTAKIGDSTPDEVRNNEEVIRATSAPGTDGRQIMGWDFSSGKPCSAASWRACCIRSWPGSVLIFKASGVFSFAQGAMVLFAALAMARFSGGCRAETGLEGKLLANAIAFVSPRPAMFVLAWAVGAWCCATS